MTVPRIAAAGGYAPRFRVTVEAFEDAWGSFDATGIEEKAVPYADEDALTMAAAAGRRALSAGDADPGEVGFLAFTSTTPPLEEEDLTARLGEMLAIPADTEHATFGQSTRAGTQALAAGIDATFSDAPGADADLALVIAADCPRGEPHDEREHAAGAGAAAFVVGDEGPAAVTDRAEHAAPYPGTRFRRRGSESIEGLDVTRYDRAAFLEAIEGAVDRLDAEPPQFDAVAIQAPDGGMPYRAAGAIGVENEAVAAYETVSELGDAGAASVPLSLARAVADGEDVLAASFGSGAGADALAVVCEDAVPAEIDLGGHEEVSYAEYLRLRGDVTRDDPEGGGAYVSMPTWRRSLPQRYRLVAGRCPECDALAFPPEGACDDCGNLVEYEDVALPGTGTAEAATTIGQGGAPPEFAVQQSKGGDFGVAVVAFDAPDGSETVSAPAQVTDGRDVDVGDRVRAAVRRIYEQEGVPRYGFKVRPADGL
ncbi:ACP synthase [Halobacteriales archaeon QS_1_68_20]|nr:MAG: ACP synthase [Halobacteriales archaeon QS_1_68_20]